MNKITKLKEALSNEWNKPKGTNLRKGKNGKVIDTREPRSYDTIKEIQAKINKLKVK